VNFLVACFQREHLQVRTSDHDQNDHSSQIDGNTEAGVVHNAALAFLCVQDVLLIAHSRRATKVANSPH
jgi:hypothetical protein